jgi:hypothetical protein
MARKPSPAPKRPYVRVTSWRRRRFFALLEETGTVKVAAELAGLGIGAIYRLRKLEPGFRERMEAAICKGSARLQEAPPPRCAGSPSPGNPGEEFEGLVPRRGQGGRVRLVSPGLHWWEPRHDEIFLLGLRGSGNVEASARAAGFTARTAYNQMRKRPRFAAECERAIAEAKPRLEDLLALQSVRWSRAAYDEAFEGEPLDERDVERAIRTLEYWDRQARRRDRCDAPRPGTAAPAQGQGPPPCPDRPADRACRRG